ncbi:MAG TPA: substrate-binding domain-containing protein [Polyangiaceae bacterium]|nr:substrate-binding domain-containing protein [Polyangiaceae bacterium]
MACQDAVGAGSWHLAELSLNQRTNIGVLVDTLDQDYQQQIVLGIDAEARSLDLDVTCFAGGVLDAPEPVHQQANGAYALCSEQRIDALIVLSGTLSNYAGMESLSQYCKRFMSLPVCSIGGALAGAVEVAVDNRAGVRQALTHLAQTCGRRRIAFVKGPPGNDEAQERFQVYKEAVDDLRLANEVELVVDGDFLEPSGARAVKTLLDDRRLGFDALMCASDLMAIGAMRALAERKVAVPQKVAVVGFDDIQAARFAAPSLATVRQPLYEQGRRALREVVARLSEKDLPGRVFLDASFIPRESCGARSLASFTTGLGSLLADPELLEPLRFEEAYRLALPRILADVRRVIEEAGFDCEPGLPETLLVQAATDIQGRRRGLLQGQSFVSFLEDVIGQMDQSPSTDVSAWQEVIAVMRRHFSLCLRQDPKWRRSADEMWHMARSSVSLLAERSQARRWLAETALSRTLRMAGTRLINVTGWAELGETLADTLGRLEVPGCFVALEEGDTHRGALAIRDRSVVLEPEGRFTRERLLPEGFTERSSRVTWLLEPLVFKRRRLGYAVFEVGPLEGRVYAALRDHLSAAIGGLLAPG